MICVVFVANYSTWSFGYVYLVVIANLVSHAHCPFPRSSFKTMFVPYPFAMYVQISNKRFHEASLMNSLKVDRPATIGRRFPSLNQIPFRTCPWILEIST